MFCESPSHPKSAIQNAQSEILADLAAFSIGLPEIARNIGIPDDLPDFSAHNVELRIESTGSTI
jgi:hypothetical protein